MKTKQSSITYCIFPRLLGLSGLLLLICASGVIGAVVASLPPNTPQLTTIKIGDTRILAPGSSGWLKGSAVVEICNPADLSLVRIDIKAKPGEVAVTHASSYPVMIISGTNDTISQPPLMVQLPRRIRKFNVSVSVDADGLESIFVQTRTRKEIGLKYYDLLLVTLAYRTATSYLTAGDIRDIIIQRRN